MRKLVGSISFDTSTLLVKQLDDGDGDGDDEEAVDDEASEEEGQAREKRKGLISQYN